MTLPSDVFTQPSLRTLHVFTDFVIAERPLVIFADMMYLVQQFSDGKLQQSEALAAFSIILLKWITPLQNQRRMSRGAGGCSFSGSGKMIFFGQSGNFSARKIACLPRIFRAKLIQPPPLKIGPYAYVQNNTFASLKLTY